MEIHVQNLAIKNSNFSYIQILKCFYLICPKLSPYNLKNCNARSCLKAEISSNMCCKEEPRGSPCIDFHHSDDSKYVPESASLVPHHD